MAKNFPKLTTDPRKLRVQPNTLSTLKKKKKPHLGISHSDNQKTNTKS